MKNPGSGFGYIVSDILLPFDTPQEEALDRARKILGADKSAEAWIIKKSVDARKKKEIKYVYTVCVYTDGIIPTEATGNQKIKLYKNEDLEIITGSSVLEAPPLVIGFGPAGMFAALLLARHGYCPVVIEQGSDVDARVEQVEKFWKHGILNTSSNVQFGEGGAGTFSDGKLTTRIGDSRCAFVLREFHSHGAPDDILYKAKPHIGTDNLRRIVKKIREEIISLGGTVKFNTDVTGFIERNNRICGVKTSDGDINAGAVILAVGNSARGLFAKLPSYGVGIEAKPFSVGVRIEHLQSDIDKALFGDFAGHPLLPRGEYQLSHRDGGRCAYTFCMCPGGVVVPSSSEEGTVATNGMSYYTRDGVNGNSALAVSVDASDFGGGPLGGIEFQRRLERVAYESGRGYAAPVQSVGRFMSGKPGREAGRIAPSYSIGVYDGDFRNIFPEYITGMMKDGILTFGRKLRGFDASDAILTGVETRTSCPVRITRGEDMQSVSAKGLYPCGEGAGYAGGIMSASADGIRCAQAVMGEYAPYKI